MKLTATVLGPVQVLADGVVVDIGGSRQRRLLVALLVQRGEAAPIDRLIDATFDGQPPDGAWRTFRTYIARLRRALDAGGADGSRIIVTVPSGYVLTADLDVDADRFEALLRSARHEIDEGDPLTALSAIEAALGLWSGPAYGEFADEEWARPHAMRLDELRLVARECQGAALVESGRHDEAIAEVKALASEQPLREEPQRLLMLALHRSGRHADALRAAHEFRRLLADETGLDWSRSLAELEQMIIDCDPRLDAPVRGRRLRGYVLGEKLSETAHAVTFRATQPAIGRDVAITAIPEHLANDPTFILRFERRAQQIAAIEHPNIVPLYDYWREPGGAYLVNRLMDGGTLAERLEGSDPVTPRAAADIVAEIGEALVAASDHGVHHGRLTADTVSFDKVGHAHLTGFSVDDDDDGFARDAVAFAALAEDLWARVVATSGSSVTICDRHHEAVREICGLTRTGGPEAFTSMADLRDALVAASHDATIGQAAFPRGIEGPNPYRGLRAFGEADAGVFFGRRTMAELLVGDLERDGIVVIVGPSGAGKSSVARAGLLPVLRDAGMYVATMVPGIHPEVELEVALSRVANSRVPELAPVLARPDGLAELLAEVLPDPVGRLVLLVDQLEEAVTLSDDRERDAVFTSLSQLVRDGSGRLQLVMTARADFLGSLLEHPVLGPLVRDHSRLVTPLGSDELYDAIVEPAAAAGVAVEPELATALVAEAIDAPGSLPLLQFALTELYEHRVDGTMTLEVHRRMGGLSAPIAQRSEEVYSTLSEDDQAATRRLFARLVTIGDGTGDARRRVLRSELEIVPQAVLDAFGDARLLTFDHDPRTREPTVEIAHEAMIRRWPRLRSWVDDDRNGLLTLRHLADSASAWDASGRDHAELYRGSRLTTADEWADEHDEELTAVERSFLSASSKARNDAVERERRRARRLRASAIAFAAIAVVAVVAGVVAVVQGERADANAREAEARTIDAERQRAIADVQRLTAESTATLDEDPDLSIRLAVEAYERMRSIGEEPPEQLITAMQTAVQTSRLLLTSTEMGGIGAISPNGDVIVARSLDDHAELVVVDAESGDEIGRSQVGSTIESIAFDVPGDRMALVLTSSDGADAGAGSTGADRIRVIHGRDFETVLDIDAEHRIQLTEFGPGGALLAAQRFIEDGSGGTWSVLVWDLARPDAAPTEHEDAVLVGWMPDGQTMALLGLDDGVVRVVDAEDRSERGPGLAMETDDAPDLSPDGRRVVFVRDDDVEVWEFGRSGPVARIGHINATVGSGVLFTPDGERVVQFGADDEVRVTTIESGASISLFGNGVVDGGGASVSADGSRLLAVAAGRIALWDLTDAGPAELGNLPTAGGIFRFRLSADGSTAIVSETLEAGARVRGVDLASASESWTTGVVAGMNPGVASDDGLVAMSATSDDVPGRVVRPSGAVVQTLRACDEVVAMDDRGRWLVVASKAFGSGGCPLEPSRILDATTGAELSEFDGRAVDFGMFGPTGTIAEDLLVVRSLFLGDDQAGSALEIRRMPENEVLGSWNSDDTGFWLPFISADGRYVTVGSGGTGAYAISIEEVLDGATMQEALALRATGVEGVATFPDAGGGWLVFGQSGDVLRFHDLDTGREEMTFPVDTGRSTMFRITADGRSLYYADAGGLLRRFPLEHRALAELARQRVQRDFTRDECRRFDIADDCSTFGGMNSGSPRPGGVEHQTMGG